MTASPANDERNRLIRRVHAEARSRGIGTDDRRDLQRRATGKESCADMTVDELRSVVAAMGTSRDRLPRGSGSRKLRALWLSAYNLGVVQDRRETALAAFLRNQAGVDAAAWTAPRDLAGAVEALKAWIARVANVDWRPHTLLGQDGRTRQFAAPRARVLEAQWRILHELGVAKIAGDSALAAYAARHAELGRADSHLALNDQQSDALIRHFGEKIRGSQ